ncbi:MAG: hypothetical protein AAF843_13415 [Bacteroidota bacterium]
MFWKRKKVKAGVYVLAGLLFLFYGLPNIINQTERATFERTSRIEQIKNRGMTLKASDSVVTNISDFYTTSSLGKVILGKHHRVLWSAEVKIPIFKGLDTVSFVKVGGGQQTTSVEVKSQSKKRYSFRSVNKDNANALPSLFRASLIRPFIRDQASALNPFSGLVVSHLLSHLNIEHPKPQMYYLPYVKSTDSTTTILGGEVVTLAEELHKSWVGHSRFGKADQILGTDDMLSKAKKGEIEIDRRLYLRCRIFDFLVSDWDRHEKQWKWGLYGTLARPIPLDRDMAFCKFDDGWASQIVRIFNDKFQSFNKKEINVAGLSKNSLALDKHILKGLKQDSYNSEVDFIKTALSKSTLETAFEAYPPEVQVLVAESHLNIIITRLENLEDAGLRFHEIINN